MMYTQVIDFGPHTDSIFRGRLTRRATYTGVYTVSLDINKFTYSVVFTVIICTDMLNVLTVILYVTAYRRRFAFMVSFISFC